MPLAEAIHTLGQLLSEARSQRSICHPSLDIHWAKRKSLTLGQNFWNTQLLTSQNSGCCSFEEMGDPIPKHRYSMNLARSHCDLHGHSSYRMRPTNTASMPSKSFNIRKSVLISYDQARLLSRAYDKLGQYDSAWTMCHEYIGNYGQANESEAERGLLHS